MTDMIYNIVDENLAEIEYYEIITLDEIIKENPTFIAFSREEIFDELYNFFKNSNKASMLTDLFYKNNRINVRNYVFIADSNKEQIEDDIEEFVKEFKSMTKMEYKEGQKEKNKFFFALAYDIQSKNLRLKPYMKTTIEIRDTVQNINLFYPVSEIDDTNIPIMAAYYNAPSTTSEDYMTHKVITGMEMFEKGNDAFNYLESEAFTDINKLIDIVKPKMKNILEKIKIDKDDFNVDYNHINNILKRFNTSLEEIDVNDFELLKKHLQDCVAEVDEHTIKYKKYKIKEITVSNEKIQFYNKIQNITNLLTFTDKMKEEYVLLIESLMDEKMNLNAPLLIYNNINDIVDAIMNNDISLEEIIQNLDANRKILVIDHTIETLKNISQNDAENIGKMLEELSDRFKLLQGTMKDIFDFHFIELYQDIKEIKEGNDYSGYDGIPDVYKNDSKFEGMVDKDDDDMLLDISATITESKLTKKSLEKYWLAIDYKDAHGFTEMLKICLPILSNVQETAVLQLNYDLLCKELYTKFAGIPTKYNIMRDILNKADMKMPDEYIKDVIKITPNNALSQLSQSSQNDIAIYTQQCNKEFIIYLYDMLYTSLAYWSLVIQEDIINDTLMFDMNLCSPTYVDKWATDEIPLKDSKQERGVLPYLCAILEDIMLENNDMGVPHAILKNSMKRVEESFTETINKLRENVKNISKKKDKGAETYTALLETIKERKKNRLLSDYIEALIYMPSYKYKKIHKFLLGCCLQKIGKDFIVDSDIDPSNRKGLIKAKEKYAAHRETNKPRYIMYVPEHIKDKHESDKENEITDTFVFPLEYQLSSEDTIKILEDWLESMRNKSSLLPNKILDDFNTNRSTKNAQIHTETFIQCLCKTSGNKFQEFQDLFLNDKNVNYKNIMNILCTIYNTFPSETSDDKMLLQNAIICIQDTLKELDKLISIINEDNKADIYRIKKYICARALCLPSNPDNAKNNILFASITVSQGFISQIAKQVYNTLIKYLRIINMPSMEDNIKFINTIREQNKVKILNTMNTKTMEERDLMNSLKKIGLKYQEENEDDDIPIINPDKNDKKDKDSINDKDDDKDDDIDYDENEDDIYEYEYAKGNEDEYDDDDLDRAEYGFIYS
jgi:hypothetical protein